MINKAAHRHKHAWITHEQALSRQTQALASLHPVFATRVESVVAHLRKKGWQAFVWEGKNRSRKQAEQNAQTGVGIKKSWHRRDIRGRLGDQVIELYAADIVDERWGWEGPAADLDHPFWNDLGEYAKAEGLEWGGEWDNRDVAHVQMKIIDAPPTGSVVV